MKTLHVWGFPYDEQGRALSRAVKNGDLGKRCVGSYQFSAMPLNCSVRFSRPVFEFDQETHRPRIFFCDGRIRSAELSLRDMKEIDADMAEVQFFDKNGLPPAELRWDLTNEEIQDLVGKGLFGFNYDIDPNEEYNPKPVDKILPVPRFFTENDMDVIIPCDVSVALMAHQGKVLPVVSVFPLDALSLRTNTRLAECDPISEWFDEPRFLEMGDRSRVRDIDFSNDKEDFLDLLDNLEVDPRSQQVKVPEIKPYIAALMSKKIAAPVLTDEQRALRDLSMRVEQRVSAVSSGERPEPGPMAGISLIYEAEGPKKPQAVAPAPSPISESEVVLIQKDSKDANEGAAKRLLASQEVLESEDDTTYLDFD